ncbi:MAG: Ig-like domain-containing protein [Coprobacillus sp.]|nr:Ig-like domain-containing protein [Coprobacillus sp.]
MKKNKKILSICLGLVLALGVTACDEVNDLLDEGGGDEDTSESDTSSEDSDTTSEGSDLEKEEDKVYVTSLTFNASSYTVEVGGSTPYSVSLEPSDATNQDYSISFYTAETHVVTTTIAATSDDNTSIIGLSAGECYIVATALDGSGVYGYASVTVNAKETPITALILSQDEITVDAGASFTISSVVGSDVVVTPDPVNADNTAWTVKEDGTSYLTIGTRGTDNSYTVEASEEGAGNTASLVLTAEADSEVSATLTVHISEVVADTHPVTDITLTKGGTAISELTLASGESLTIGAVDSNADIIVVISPDNADEVGFTVSTENSDIVTISEPAQETGIVTVKALDNTSWTADKEATIKVVTKGTNSSGATLEATLKVIVPRPVEYVNKLDVTPKSISLVTNEEILLTSLDGFSVTIYNQYNEVISGVGWTASVTSEGDYLTLTGSSSTDYTIKAVSAGSATITITASGTEIKDTIAVSITDKVYEVTSIEMDAETYNLGHGLGGETSEDYPASIDLAQHVKYINNEGGSDGLASSSQYGVTAEITTNTDNAITLSGTVVTAIGVGSASVTLTSTANTSLTAVANIVINDITDYKPTSISVTPNTATVSTGSTALSEVVGTVTILPSYACQKYEVSVASGSDGVLSIDNENLIATNATNSDVTGTLEIYPIYEGSAYTSVTPATIIVTVKTDYVAVTSVTITPTTLALTEGETGTVSISEIVPSNATNASSVSWSSSNTSAATVDNYGVVTAVSADYGTADITATVDGVVSNSCTVTINPKITSVKNYTVVWTLMDSSNQAQVAPTYGHFYIEGDFNKNEYGNWNTADESWQLTEITSNGNTAYSFTFSELEYGSYKYQIVFGYDDEDTVGWNPVTSGDWTLEITNSISDGTTDYKTLTGCHTVASEYEEHGFDVTVYFCLVGSTSSYLANGVSLTIKCTDGNIFVNNGDQDGYYDWDSMTYIAAKVNGSDRGAYYQTSEVVLAAGVSHWLNFCGPNDGVNSTYENYYIQFTVPSDLGSVATFVCYGDLSKFTNWNESGSSSSWSAEASGGTWYSGAPSDVVGSLTYSS